MLYLVSPDETLVQPTARLARNLSFEHMVFDLRGQDTNAEEYQNELARLVDNIQQIQPASADRPAS